MRRRITRLSVTAVVIAVVVFAVPLAVAARLLLVSQQFDELQRAALSTAARVDAASLGSADPVEGPSAPAGITVSVIPAEPGPAGVAPAASGDPLLRIALAGTPSQGSQGRRLVAVVPVVQGETVRGVVRASSSAAATWWRTLAAWAVIALAAVVSTVLAWAVSRRRVRGLVRPVEQLAVDVRSLGRPGVDIAGRRSGLPEVDTVADALADTSARLGELRRRERAFGDRASHQLRTPLAGLELILEEALANRPGAARGAIEESLAVARRLEQTIDDVLRFTRPDIPTPLSEPAPTAGLVVEGLDERWRSEFARQGRPLSLAVASPNRQIASSPAALRQTLDVLLENALRHGSGAVAVDVRDVGTHVAIDVHDDGEVNTARVSAGPAGPRALGGGLGLDLAWRMVEAEGGRLLLSSRRPTTFTVLLRGAGEPARAPAADPAGPLTPPVR